MGSHNSAKPVVSALLPMGRVFDRVYAEAIVPCSTEFGLEPQRVATQFSERDALLRIHDQIRRSHLIIADLTAKNPNVLYEIGYAHAVPKRVVLIAQHGEDLPFHPSEYPTVIYAGNTSELLQPLREIFEKIATGLFAGNSSNGSAASPETARDRFLSLFGDLLVEHGYEHRGGVHLENEKTFVLMNQDMDLALVQALARRGRELGIRLKLL